ncbi:hypothetical protein Mapa_013419 [Marchantia paleacea]|nr:hypothetical protein Mapa_013419 [Marchantia paleacea]
MIYRFCDQSGTQGLVFIQHQHVRVYKPKDKPILTSTEPAGIPLVCFFKTSLGESSLSSGYDRIIVEGLLSYRLN